MKENLFIQINKEDNVAVAVNKCRKNQLASVAGNSFAVLEDIPVGHKIALEDLEKGTIIYKYGTPIGYAVKDIKQGEWVHSHNMSTLLSGKLEYEYNPKMYAAPDVKGMRDTFWGYEREGGQVGTRNELWIIPTVSCVNPTVTDIAESVRKTFDNLCDGVFAFPHNSGCSQLGRDHRITQEILSSIIRHPNAGGVLLVSLGCENNNFDEFLPVLGEINSARVKLMVCQDVEGDEVQEGVKLVGELLEEMKKDRRTKQHVSKLCLGFKCGGSDAFSGITANPLCGMITDRLTAMGGTAVLTEVPEMFGAEQYLMDRSKDEETFLKVVKLINDFKQYYMDHGQSVYENPSPGNKAGGITTLEEKSLGCIEKGGHAPITDTLGYGERCCKKGLNLMTGPGNDSVSVTNLVAAGAGMILFTTGRGNPLGTAIPVVKISSNSALAQRKKKWIDYNAGNLLEDADWEKNTDDLWNLLLDIASGICRTKNEINHNRSIMIFKDGVML